jgi:hypothetical protein
MIGPKTENQDRRLCSGYDMHTVFLMEVSDFPHKFSWLDHIETELIPRRQSTKLWAWEVGKKTEKESVCHAIGEPSELERAKKGRRSLVEDVGKASVH